MSDLGSFLDTKPTTRKTSAATVGGNTPEGEVYIRADGKKVRRVRKVVKRTPSDRSLTTEGKASGKGMKKTPSDRSLTAEGKSAGKGLKKSPSSGSLTSVGNTGGKGLKKSPSNSSLASETGGKKSSLGNFLGSGSPGPGSKKSGSATVAGDRNLSSSSYEEGEIYIRADGKKVRRVKKVKSSASSVGPLGSNAKSSASSVGPLGSNAKSSASSVGPLGSNASFSSGVSKDDSTPGEKSPSPASKASSSSKGSKPKKDLGSFLNRQSGNTVSSRKASKSVSGRSASGFSVKSKDSDVYINKDGKKVRKMKKSSASVGGEIRSTPDSRMLNRSTSSSRLGGLSRQTSSSKLTRQTSSSKLTRQTSSSKLTRQTSSSKLTRQDSSSKLTRQNSSSKLTKQLSASKLDAAPKPIARSNSSSKINNDPVSPAPQKQKASPGGLGGFLENGDKPLKKPNRLSAASVAGSTPATQGDVYIRADGKKVRRVRKAASSASSVSVTSSLDDTGSKESDKKQSSLSNFLGSGSGPSLPKKSASATVAGDGRNLSSASTASALEGEIYIRPDGKKVRRVRRANSAAAPSKPGANGGSPGLGSFLSKSTTEGSTKITGAATVTGASSSPASKEGEIYINKDGKKVRRVRKSASSVAGTSQSTAGDLAGFLDKPGTPAGNSAKYGGASVSGSTPTQDGEIYIRPDGKKVRRVRRSPSGNVNSSSSVATPSTQETTPPKKTLGRSDGGRALSALLDANPKKSPSSMDGNDSIHEAATVAGDRVIKSTDEGEIVIRADGKKVRRIRKPRDGTSSTSSQEGEVYRRADGKLVRRIRKPAAAADAGADNMNKSSTSIDISQTENSSVGPVSKLSPEDEQTAETYRKMLTMGLPDDAVKHKMIQDGAGSLVIQSVLNREVPASAGSATNGATSTAPTLSEDEEAAAGKFRKMLKMGLPEDAVRQKMTAEGLDPKVIASVVGGDMPPPAKQSPSTQADSGAEKLSEEEEATADRFRKMLKMGLPGDAVKHKMVVEGVDAKIITAVFYEGSRDETSSTVQKSSVSGAQSAPSSSLTDDEEVVATRFRKMLNMGLPADAVKHKMSAEGVDERVISAVLNPPSDSTTGAVDAPSQSSSAPSLSAEDEATARRFKKMLTMGLPEDAVKHKMIAEGVQENVMNHVLKPSPAGQGQTSQSTSPPAPRVESSGHSLSDDEEIIAAKYRKMLRMGMPSDAVDHKMQQDGVEPKIVLEVLGSSSAPPTSTPASTQGSGVEASSSSAVTAPSTGGAGAAYVVVVADDSGPKPEVATAAELKVNPDDKFTVSVADGQGGKGVKKLMSLDEIANATGQSKEELEKMVKEKQEKGESSSFVLNHASAPKQAEGNMFEVEIATGSPGPAAAAPASSPMDPSKTYSEIKTGQEVVDSKLADAARAVSALGDMDMKALLSKLQAGDMELLLNKLQEAEKRQKKLEKQLAQAGVAIAEDIDYAECKVKVEEIAKRMGEIGGSDVTVADKEEQNKLREEYFKLEQQMEKYNTALMLTEEYQAEQDRIEKKWEDDNAPKNLEALKKIRRHMPVKIRHMSEADLTNQPSPNGKFLPTAIAKKFKRTNVLQCLRINPADLERMHPSTLENMRVTGLTLTERRALYAHLKILGPKWEKNKSEKMTERKWTWYQMMKNNFKENVAPYDRHVAQYGPPENHQGCPLLGKQCPIKADKLIDYDNDYGYTDEAEYEVSDVKKADTDDPGAKAMLEAQELAKEKKANERADILKKHYKGKLLQVSKANGSCEAMDEAMDRMENHTTKWLEFVLDKGDNLADADKKKEIANFTDALNELKLSTLDFAQRSGMQMSGKRKAGGDAEDIRSSVEGGLADEVYETSQEFFGFIRNRMKETDSKDTRIEKTIELLEGMLSELHTKNTELYAKLEVKRPERSRKLKKVDELKKEAQERMKPKEDAPPPEAAAAGPPAGRGGGRGGLLDAIGRGRGRDGGGGGRGGLLDAIAGKGRGGRGGGGGRGGLLDAISGARGRGRGGGDGGDGGGGGRGGLLSAIQGRGAKGDGGGGGGRGGLLAAIQSRGGG